jgi:hypothetical protein
VDGKCGFKKYQLIVFPLKSGGPIPSASHTGNYGKKVEKRRPDSKRRRKEGTLEAKVKEIGADKHGGWILGIENSLHVEFNSQTEPRNRSTGFSNALQIHPQDYRHTAATPSPDLTTEVFLSALNRKKQTPLGTLCVRHFTL